MLTQAPKYDDDRLNLVRANKVKELYPDSQISADFLQAVNDVLFVLLKRAYDRKNANHRTRFFPCDV